MGSNCSLYTYNLTESQLKSISYSYLSVLLSFVLCQLVVISFWTATNSVKNAYYLYV